MSVSEIRKDEAFEKTAKWFEFMINDKEELKLIFIKDGKEKEVFFYKGAAGFQLRFKAEYIEASI